MSETNYPAMWSHTTEERDPQPHQCSIMKSDSSVCSFLLWRWGQ